MSGGGRDRLVDRDKEGRQAGCASSSSAQRRATTINVNINNRREGNEVGSWEYSQSSSNKRMVEERLTAPARDTREWKLFGKLRAFSTTHHAFYAAKVHVTAVAADEFRSSTWLWRRILCDKKMQSLSKQLTERQSTVHSGFAAPRWAEHRQKASIWLQRRLWQWAPSNSM